MSDGRVCVHCHKFKLWKEFSAGGCGENGCVTFCRACAPKGFKHRPRLIRRPYTRQTLLKRYGLTEAIYTAMVKSQNDKCAICGDPRIDKHWNIDHDHLTGKTRELLCRSCNSALGLFRDRAEILDRAAAYLRKHDNHSNSSTA